MSTILCVSDLERLAKAGVKIELIDVIVTGDKAVPSAHSDVFLQSLESAFWQRWNRAHVGDNSSRAHYDANPGFSALHRRAYSIYAHEYGDKVYIMVAPTKEPPFIVEDERYLYPSDALMAKLVLYEKSDV